PGGTSGYAGHPGHSGYPGHPGHHPGQPTPAGQPTHGHAGPAAPDWEEPFGTLLARLRKDAGFTQERLADAAGLSVRAISSLECGVRHPRQFTLDRLAGSLSLSAAQRSALIAAAQRARRAARPDTGPRTPPLTGRAVQLDALRRHLAGEGPPVLVFDGEPGIGKSRMLAEAATLGAIMGLAVLVGTATPGSDDFAPFAQLLADHVRRATAAMLAGCAALRLLLPEYADRLPPLPPGPDGGPPSLAQRRRLIFEAVGRYLATVARGRRRLLVLDDLQWAGPEAGALLVHLVRQGGGQVRVVAGLRSGEGDGPLLHALADLGRQGQLHGYRLAPLTPGESARLVDATAGPGLGEPDRTTVVRRSGGLPLYLVELARTVAGGTQEVPWHLRMAVGQQLATLPDPVLRLLTMLAIGGPCAPLGPLDAAELAGLDLACRRGILVETRQGLRFRYPLVREVLATNLGPTRRRLWREALAPTA
ncbi:MAG TPA: AAA family ATPase, partial [Rugosimonospora sp.]|nr:AAA family ATPase [Rugosimonospora sp.]